MSFFQKTYIFTVFFLFSIEISAQTSEFKHYSTEDGLASSEVYTQLQDDAGYMWFGTSRGLCRFDGYRFENFTASDGLASNSIIKIFKDRFGRVWFSTYDGSLTYFCDGKFIVYQYNDTVLKLDKNYYANMLIADKDTNLWIAPAQGGLFKISLSGEVTDVKPQSNVSCFYFKDIDGDVIGNFFRADSVSDSVYLKVEGNDFYIFGAASGTRKKVIKIRDGEYVVFIGRNLYYIRNNHITASIKRNSDIADIMIDNKKNLWVSVLFSGLYRYRNADISSIPEVYLKEMSPSSVIQDKQDGYWISTTENGLYYTASMQFNYYDKYGISSLNILSLTIFNSRIYLSTYDRYVIKSKLHGHNILSIDALRLLPEGNFLVQDIAYTADSAIWFLGKKLVRYKNGEFKLIRNMTKSYGLFAKGNKLYAFSNGFVLVYQGDSLINQYKFADIPTTNAIFVDDNETIWLGTINGLYKIQNNSLQYLGDDDKTLKFRINDIAQVDNYLILATNGNGIIFFNKKNQKVYVLNSHDKINSGFVNAILVNNKFIWAGTNNGVCKISFIEQYDSLNIATEQFNEIDGLYADEIKDIAINGKCIFLGTTIGLISFYPADIQKNMKTPMLMFDSITVNNRRLNKIDSMNIFASNQRTISFYFKGISFSAGKNVKYKYILKGFDDKEIITSERFLRFPNLPPGKYTLYIYASSDGIVWSRNPLIFSFVIKKRFVDTFLFYFFVFLLLIILAFLALNYKYSQLDKEIRQKRHLIRSEQKALRSQMNPHFIFNALNSIRRYILENDVDNADFYLSNFAMLMRRVLENSKQEYISLEQEIETLKLYLELEKMRFDESFNFSVEIDENITLSRIFVPTMLIQPVIENSIWHGLAPLQQNGQLILSLKQLSKNKILCFIQDNGIGRQKAA